MSPTELVAASEAKLRDAENNLALCVASLNDAKRRYGGVPNEEVVALAQAQAVLAQAYSNLAIAKTVLDGAPYALMRHAVSTLRPTRTPADDELDLPPCDRAGPASVTRACGTGAGPGPAGRTSAAAPAAR